jgi:2-alkenal reductase
MTERFVRLALISMLLLLGTMIGYDYVQLFLFSERDPRAVTPRAGLTDMEQNAIQVFEKIAPSVVFVTTIEPSGFGELADPKHGMGSGFIWDGAGHIVTNHHVVQGATQIDVRFSTGDIHQATLVGTAPDYELAVLRVQARNRLYYPVPLGSSADLRVGQAVFAIGNPYGLSRSFTQGLVSAVERRLPTAEGREIEGIIQTDAALNPGNSGGPLLDSAGRLIGVNTAIVSGTGAFAGVGFAVPVDVVNHVVSTLIRDGSMPRPGIGISALNEYATAQLNEDGVVVVEVVPGSPAAEAGLQGMDMHGGHLGDVIMYAENKRVQRVAELAAVFQEVGVGRRVTLHVRRQGRSRFIEVQVIDIGKVAPPQQTLYLPPEIDAAHAHLTLRISIVSCCERRNDAAPYKPQLCAGQSGSAPPRRPKTFGEPAFKLHGAMRRGVMRENAPAAGGTDAPALVLGQVPQDAQNLVRPLGDDDLVTDLEKGVESRPAIRADRGCAGCGLEQPHARCMAERRHIGPRQIQCAALGVVEVSMRVRGQMLDPLDIGGPVDVRRIQRPGDRKAALGPGAGRLAQQPLELRLPIRTVGAHVA